jgi:hypothetical protein
MMLVAGFVLCLVSCQTPQNLAKNQAAAQEWLNLQTAGARIQVSGTWFSADWGKAMLKQSGRQITGTIDMYEVKGVVSGNKAYLTTWDSGKCYYAVILSQTDKNVLTGSYTKGPTYLTHPKEQRPIELRRSY